MAYNLPGVRVYQELENSGGVLDSTPDLDACIIGPAYNVLKYVSGDTTSLVQTAATSAATIIGSTTVDSYVVLVDGVPPFSVGDVVFIPGATQDAATLQATVTAVASGSFTIGTKAGTAVTGAVITKQGKIVNPLVTNTFNFPAQKPGQNIVASSVQVFVNNSTVQTISTKFTAVAGTNVLNMLAASGTCTAVGASATITGVTNATLFAEGDAVVVAGAGASGADLLAKILSITSTTFVLNTNAGTGGSNLVITKSAVSNLSAATSTLLVEPGDSVTISYTNTANAAATFTTLVTKVVNITGTLTQITTADVMPANMSVSTLTSAGAAANANTIAVTSVTGISAGDRISIAGAGAGGTDLLTVVGAVSGSNLNGLSPVVATAFSAGAVVKKVNNSTVKTRKVFNNQLLPVTKPSGGTNYTISTTNGTVSINPNAELVYGTVVASDVHIGYKALRTDLSGSILEIADVTDNLGVLGEATAENPLALGVLLALANTTTRVKAIAIPSDDLAGYLEALEVAEGGRVYALTPLTQDIAVLTSFAAHVSQMSTPEMKSWRMALVNTAIPTTVSIGPWSIGLVNANSGNNSIGISAGKYVLNSSNSTFISDGLIPGDTITITAGSGSPSPVGAHQVLEVVSNQQVVLDAQGIATGVSFYASRALSKSQKAEAVASVSSSFLNKRVVHVQSDTVGVSIGGVLTYVPGYYLACAVAGMIAGLVPQAGLTNMTVAGISDIKYSNFYFTRAQLGAMAEVGTLLVVQESAGSPPYIRHELTTDVSVLEYREIQAVKNWDFLSYYYSDKLASFIGVWNITPDTIQTIRQTITAAGELIKGKKVPKLGAPLTSFTIRSLEQSPTNKDQLICKMGIVMPSVLNMLDLYLIV